MPLLLVQCPRILPKLISRCEVSLIIDAQEIPRADHFRIVGTHSGDEVADGPWSRDVSMTPQPSTCRPLFPDSYGPGAKRCGSARGRTTAEENRTSSPAG